LYLWCSIVLGLVVRPAIAVSAYSPNVSFDDRTGSPRPSFPTTSERAVFASSNPPGTTLNTSRPSESRYPISYAPEIDV